MIIFMIEKEEFSNYYSKLKHQYANNTLDYALINVTGTSIIYPPDEIEKNFIENKRTFINSFIKTTNKKDIKELYKSLNDNNKNTDKNMLLNKYFFIPWFYFYPDFEQFKVSFFSYLTKNKSYFTSINVDITDNYFNSICIKNLKTYANPTFGKIPLQSFDNTVIRDPKDFDNKKYFDKLLLDWFDFFNKNNSSNYSKFKEKFILAYNEIKNLDKENMIRKKNKAEYTICFTSEKEVFNDLIAKIVAKFKQNSLTQKKLAYLLALDNNQSLYHAQRNLILDFLDKIDNLLVKINYKQIFNDYNDNTIPETIKKNETEYDNLKKDFVNKINEKAHEKVLKNTYFNLHYKKYEYISLHSGKLLSYLLIKFYNSSEYFPFIKSKYKNEFKNCCINDFYQLVYFFINYEEMYKEKLLILEINILKKTFPLVSMGAVILNDIRKCFHTFRSSNGLIHVEKNQSNIITNKGLTSIINRDNSRYNMIGKASYNVRNYELTTNIDSYETIENISNLSDLEKVRLRNRYLSDIGFDLGNGISGHIDAIQRTFLEISEATIDKNKLIAVINCSMFLFWSLFYDKTSTAVHSYIEVFESRSIKNENELTALDLNDIFISILKLYQQEKFDAVNLIERLKNMDLFQKLTKNDLKKSLNDKIENF